MTVDQRIVVTVPMPAAFTPEEIADFVGLTPDLTVARGGHTEVVGAVTIVEANVLVATDQLQFTLSGYPSAFSRAGLRSYDQAGVGYSATGVGRKPRLKTIYRTPTPKDIVHVKAGVPWQMPDERFTPDALRSLVGQKPNLLYEGNRQRSFGRVEVIAAEVGADGDLRLTYAATRQQLGLVGVSLAPGLVSELTEEAPYSIGYIATPPALVPQRPPLEVMDLWRTFGLEPSVKWEQRDLRPATVTVDRAALERVLGMAAVQLHDPCRHDHPDLGFDCRGTGEAVAKLRAALEP